MEATNIGWQPARNVLLFIILILFQILVCNNILLFGLAVPFPFIYFIVFLPLRLNLNVLLTIAFLLGFTVDLFSDTLGLSSLCCLIIAILKKPVFYAYMPREDKNVDIVPSNLSMGWSNYVKYAFSLSVIFCILLFFIEFTSFAAFGRIIAMASLSAVFTLLFMLGIDALVTLSSRNQDR